MMRTSRCENGERYVHRYEKWAQRVITLTRNADHSTPRMSQPMFPGLRGVGSAGSAAGGLRAGAGSAEGAPGFRRVSWAFLARHAAVRQRPEQYRCGFPPRPFLTTGPPQKPQETAVCNVTRPVSARHAHDRYRRETTGNRPLKSRSRNIVGLYGLTSARLPNSPVSVVGVELVTVIAVELAGASVSSRSA